MSNRFKCVSKHCEFYNKIIPCIAEVSEDVLKIDCTTCMIGGNIADWRLLSGKMQTFDAKVFDLPACPEDATHAYVDKFGYLYFCKAEDVKLAMYEDASTRDPHYEWRPHNQTYITNTDIKFDPVNWKEMCLKRSDKRECTEWIKEGTWIYDNIHREALRIECIKDDIVTSVFARYGGLVEMALHVHDFGDNYEPLYIRPWSFEEAANYVGKAVRFRDTAKYSSDIHLIHGITSSGAVSIGKFVCTLDELCAEVELIESSVVCGELVKCSTEEDV